MSLDDRLIGLATFAAADAEPERIAAVFQELPGVLLAGVGAAGGLDAVQVEFDPGRISYAGLLDVLAREAKSATIFWHSTAQARAAAARFAVERAPVFERA